MLGFLATFILFSSAAPAADPSTVTPPASVEPVPATSDLSLRLNALQTNKNCIHSAKTKADVEKCRGAIQIKRDRD